MFSLLYTFCLHFYLINNHVFDYPDSRLSVLFTEVPTSPDNRGSTVQHNNITGRADSVELCTNDNGKHLPFSFLPLIGFLLSIMVP